MTDPRYLPHKRPTYTTYPTSKPSFSLFLSFFLTLHDIESHVESIRNKMVETLDEQTWNFKFFIREKLVEQRIKFRPRGASSSSPLYFVFSLLHDRHVAFEFPHKREKHSIFPFPEWRGTQVTNNRREGSARERNGYTWKTVSNRNVRTNSSRYNYRLFVYTRWSIWIFHFESRGKLFRSFARFSSPISSNKGTSRITKVEQRSMLETSILFLFIRWIWF